MKNFLFKKILIVFIFCLSFLVFPIVVNANSSPNSLIIHYYRYNNDYNDGWNAWIWEKAPTDGAGADFTFDRVNNEIVTDDFGALITIDLTKTFKNATRIGIILKKGSWEKKDTNSDRFIDIPETTANSDGIVHVYFVEGDERIGYSLNDPNGPDRTDKIAAAYFATEKTIKFTLTAPLAKDKITLEVDGVKEDIDVDITKATGIITLTKNLDFSKSYVLKATFNSGIKTYDVTYDGIYDSEAFNNAYGYEGNDLGAIVSENKTTFRIWAPISLKVVLNIYETGTPSQYGGTDTPKEVISMQKSIKGTWYYETSKSYHGFYYTYSITNGSKTTEVIDPYAKSAGINGIRGMIIDFSKANPKGFKYNNRAQNIINATDAIIYELHVRDLTSHSSWTGSEENRGKLLGLSESGTSYNGVTTGFDHIKELGITHIQILPFFDHGVIDETRLNDKSYQNKELGIFNWGYMPQNYNVIEGSYSSNPYDGLTRVNELKQVSTAFTENNIGLIMDVVYNHTGQTADSNFNIIVPGYYYRLNSDGTFSNGSGCGNETASERYMMQKFMVDSVSFWATEYNISGFRFDLMALHDVTTMNMISDALYKIDKNILIYGEPWNGGSTTLSTEISADKVNLDKIANIAAFNDETRDGIKGSVFSATDKGFVQGRIDDKTINKIKYGVVGGIDFEGIDKSILSYGKAWNTSPLKTINYVSAHDNNTLYDKIVSSTSSTQKELRDEMQKQANAIVMTSQGIVFLHAGVEFMRSKPNGDGTFNSNSYQSSDSVNQLRWDIKAKETNMEVFNYYKGLIELRKNHPAFRMTTVEDIKNNVKFVYEDKKNILAYTISNYANDDTWGTILVIHNNSKYTQVTLPEGSWNLVGDSTRVGTTTIKTYEGGQTINIFDCETVILYQGEKVIEKTGCKANSSLILLYASFTMIGFSFIRRKRYLEF